MTDGLDSTVAESAAIDTMGTAPPQNCVLPGPGGGAAHRIEFPPLALPGTVSTPDIPADLLPDPVGAMVDAVARTTQTPPGAGVILGLGILATCAQRRYVVAPKNTDYVEPVTLWTLAAIESGSRKSAVLNALMQPLNEWEKHTQDSVRSAIARNAAAREAAKKRLEKLARDAGNENDRNARDRIVAEMEQEKVETPAELFAPSLYVSDATVERVQAVLVEQRGRCAVISDEAGQFAILAGMYSGAVNVDTFLQGHSGSPVRVARSGRSAGCGTGQAQRQG
jgi:putative DNA primase/helicase